MLVSIMHNYVQILDHYQYVLDELWSFKIYNAYAGLW